MTEADEPPTPIDRDSDIDPDEIPELTDADRATMHAFDGVRYLGPAEAVLANGWRAVVPETEQQKTAAEVLWGGA